MKETKYKNYFADESGIVYSGKSGILKPLKQRKSNQGYYAVCIYDNGKQFQRYVHRIIAETFIRELDRGEKETVNHIDGNKANNSLENLEIISVSKNVKHSYQIGLHRIGESHERAKFSNSLISSALHDIERGNSVNSIAKKYGISQSYLNKIKNGSYRKDLSKDKRKSND